MACLVIGIKFRRKNLPTLLMLKWPVTFAIEDSFNTFPFPKYSCHLLVVTSLSYVHFTSEKSKLYHKVETFPDYIV